MLDAVFEVGEDVSRLFIILAHVCVFAGYATGIALVAVAVFWTIEEVMVTCRKAHKRHGRSVKE